MSGNVSLQGKTLFTGHMAMPQQGGAGRGATILKLVSGPGGCKYDLISNICFQLNRTL